MPFILILIGLALIISAIRGQAGALGTQVATDFSGFLVWVGALGVVGALGYIKPLKPFSDAFLGLILLTFVLKNGGLFAQLQSALSNPSASLPDKPVSSK